MGRVSAFAGWRKSGLLVFALATVAVLAASPAAAQNPKLVQNTDMRAGSELQIAGMIQVIIAPKSTPSTPPAAVRVIASNVN